MACLNSVRHCISASGSMVTCLVETAVDARQALSQYCVAVVKLGLPSCIMPAMHGGQSLAVLSCWASQAAKQMGACHVVTTTSLS